VSLPDAEMTAPVTCAFGGRSPAPARSLEVAPGVPRAMVDCGLDDVATRGLGQPLFHQALERSDRAGYWASRERIAHLDHLPHAGCVRRQSAAHGVLRFIATSTPEHS